MPNFVAIAGTINGCRSTSGHRNPGFTFRARDHQASKNLWADKKYHVSELFIGTHPPRASVTATVIVRLMPGEVDQLAVPN